MKTIILIAMIAAVAYAEETAPAEAKKQEKRGVLGLGYGGGYYGGLAGHGLHGGYAGYGGYGAAPLISHGSIAAPAAVYSHGVPAVSYSHAYSAPAVYNPYRVSGLGYNHGLAGYNNVHASGYNGLGLGLGHGYNYLNGGHYW